MIYYALEVHLEFKFIGGKCFMNKAIGLILFLAVLFFVSLPFTDAQVAEEEAALWKVSDVSSGQTYSKSYSYENCTINVRKDGKGVEIIISNPDYHGKSVMQSIIIGKDTHNQNVFEIKTSIVSGYQLCSETRGYDLFFVQYINAAKKLPEKVKKAFLGYYNSNLML